MEILTSFIIPFLILLTVVVFVHEYGHYYFAKKYGVGVTDFSIGFGKEIFGFNDKSGTRWKFCAIPLGGYVKFFGDRNVFSQAEQEQLLKEYNKEDQQKLFVVKPLYQRSLIVAAGPFANFIYVLKATLPAGTLSGAPKVRAMEIIDELEPDRRGVYGGAVGYLSWTGNMDTAIAIRTAVIQNNTVKVRAGGGIVHDSDPESEFQESLNKAQSIFKAIEDMD